MPDGRSSYNLTPDDIKGVVFNYDVINYDRTVTDTDVIGIWHLDGDYTNSVNNNTSDNQWNNNFVDGRFNGCVIREGSLLYTYDSNSAYKNTNNIYLHTPLSSMPSEWTLEFWVWCPDTSTTIFTGNDGLLHRSVPLPLLFESVPSWYSVAIQSDGTCYVNGYAENRTPFWQLGYTRNSSGWFDKFVSLYQLGSYLNICFSYTGTSTMTSVNGTNYIDEYMSTFAIDEVVFTARKLYSSEYKPRLEPHDLSFAYTVPTIQGDNSTIAIQSPVNVHNTQIGGVRSSDPIDGDVFISLYDGRATSITQYYNGIWNNVNGAVYFGEEWKNLYQYDFNKMMLVTDDDSVTGATYIINYYGDSDTYVDISGDDITFTIDTAEANPEDVVKLLKWIPLLFGAVGTILGTLVPFMPSWLTGLIAMCLGAVITLILFVFIRRK